MLLSVVLCIFRYELIGYPPVEWQDFTKEKLAQHLENEKSVLVVVRAKRSLWSFEWIGERWKRDAYWGHLVVLDFQFEEGESGLARSYFKDFGFTKEALLVLYEPNTDPKRVEVDYSR